MWQETMKKLIDDVLDAYDTELNETQEIQSRRETYCTIESNNQILHYPNT